MRACASFAFFLVLGAVEGGPQSLELCQGRPWPGLVPDNSMGTGHDDSPLVGRIQTNPAHATSASHLSTREDGKPAQSPQYSDTTSLPRTYDIILTYS